MPSATTLRDLLRIRRHNASRLRSLPGYLGSAVGFKYIEHSGRFDLDANGRPQPAVILFVERKLSSRELGKNDKLDEELDGPDGLSCLTDVVTGVLGPQPPPSPGPDFRNATLMRELHETVREVTGGLPISSPYTTGTAGCVVKRRDDGSLGLLTNWHVAGPIGSTILQPPPNLRPIGVTSQSIYSLASNDLAPETTTAEFSDADYRIDAGLVELHSGLARRARPGVHGLGALGAPHTIDFDSMDLIGRRVTSVGQTLGRQTGTVMACGYEWRPDRSSRQHEITDYLILGKNGRAFAAPGDSGKLVVTDDNERRPVALLWGGQRQRFWSAHAQESWNYASAIRPVLDALDVDLLGQATASAARPAASLLTAAA